jgi:ABC-type phosphate/phosphonate transport system substrate-binding protein
MLPFPVSAELIMSAPPRETAEQGWQIYGPLADYFSIILNEKVSYQHPGNWMNYQKTMREGGYDIVFDGPHFISWRMKNANHIPLVKLPGNLEFYLVASHDNKQVNSVRDLIGKKICGMPPPNLATLSVRALYDNPMQQPIFIGISGSFAKVHQALKDGKCDAAVLRSSFYTNNLPPEKRKALKIVHQSEKMPNQGISVHKLKVSAQARTKLIKALSSQEGVDASARLLNRFSKNQPRFLATRPEEYEKYASLIEGQIFGW